MTSSDEMRHRLLDVAKALAAKGLVEHSSGNVSGRLDSGTVCMTPSSIPYDEMTADDMVIVDLDGELVEGERSPSTEKSLHLACYRAYDEIGGVIHSHPVYASMFAVARQPIPAAIEEVAVYIGGDIPVCEYRTTGTDELGDEVAANLADRAAALMANHGMVTVGRDPEKALHAAAVVERTAKIVWGARMLGNQESVPAKVNEDFAGVYRFVRENQL